jgi:hypothetical protein
VAVNVVSVGSPPRAEVESKVRIRSSDANGVTGLKSSKGAVDQKVPASVEAEAVKVDSRRR